MQDPLPNWKNEAETITPEEAIAAIEKVLAQKMVTVQHPNLELQEIEVGPVEKLIKIISIFGALNGEMAKAVAIEGDNRRVIAQVTGKRAWEF